LHPVSQPQLGEDVTDVGLHRRFREEEPFRNFGVRQTLRHEQQHLVLPIGELLVGRRWFLVRRDLMRESVEETPGDAGTHDRVPGGDDTDRADQLRGRDVFEEASPGGTKPDHPWG
jgi:hypothetical protein